ncbi:MAG: phosphatase PAP2 family protein, partial [Blastopirellula sp. JB062]
MLPIPEKNAGRDGPHTLAAALWRERWSFLTPLALLSAFTALCFLAPIDMASSRYVYLTPFDGWAGDYWFTEDLCYYASPVPGIVLGIGACLVLVVGLWSSALAKRRQAAGLLLCVVLAGPLILVNGVLKPGMSRPRPCQLATFGGGNPQVVYVAPWQASSAVGKSFPSGHASMGFLWMAPAFLYWRRNYWASAAWLTIGVVLGLAVGYFRMAVGAHFVSDIVWSGGIVYFSG